MRFNLLLYVPALENHIDIEYGIFIQHHLMDDANVTVDYYDFSKINPENYALDIVTENQVTKKVRKDCLIEGFTLNSHYTIDLDTHFNRNIARDEVRQVFVCFKNNTKAPIDAFICLTHNDITTNYKIKDNLIFFRLWVAPEMQSSSETALNIGKINYTDFNYFCDCVKAEVNHQWHAILKQKINQSKTALQKDIPQPPPIPQHPSSSAQKPPKAIKHTATPSTPSRVVMPVSVIASSDNQELTSNVDEHLAIDNQTAVATKEGSRLLKIIAYTLLSLGIISILIKILSN